MSAALHLVPAVGAGDDDGGGLTTLEQWELYMRGAGRSERTISETLGVLGRLEQHSGRRVENVTALDVSRFLGRRRLKQNSRAAYFGYIASFYRWWSEHGGANLTIEVFEGEGHTLHRTAFERFAASVKAFLTSP